MASRLNARSTSHCRDPGSVSHAIL